MCRRHHHEHSHGSSTFFYQPKHGCSKASQWVGGTVVTLIGGINHSAEVFIGLKPVLQNMNILSDSALRAVLFSAAGIEFIENLFFDGKFTLNMFGKLGDFVISKCASLGADTEEHEDEPPSAFVWWAARVISAPFVLLGGFVHASLSYVGVSEMLEELGVQSANVIIGIAVFFALIDFVQSLAKEGSHLIEASEIGVKRAIERLKKCCSSYEEEQISLNEEGGILLGDLGTKGYVIQ